MILTLIIIAVMTTICVLGTELSAMVQRVMIIFQVAALLMFAVVLLLSGGPLTPELSWISPFAVDSSSALILGLLTGVFIYWGWESAVNLNEETENSNSAPGLAAIVSTVVLLVTYVVTTVAVVAYAGLGRVEEFEDDPGIFGALATDALPSPLDKLVVFAIVTSAIASTQTTILPASRTALSMARQGAFPEVFGRIHPRYLTPHIANDHDRGDRGRLVRRPVPAVGELRLRLAHRAVVHDRLLLRPERLLVRDLLPPRADQVGEELRLHRRRAGGGWPDPRPTCSSRRSTSTGRSMTRTAVPRCFGIGIPVVLGVGLLLLGVILMLLWRAGAHEKFFGRKREIVDPDVASGQKLGVAAVPEEAIP